jgi:nickel transport protein
MKLLPIRRMLAGVAIALSLFLLPGQALAHSVQTDFQLISEIANRAKPATQLEVKSSYDTGDNLANARVLVFAPNDSEKPWMEGMTDAQGKFIFQPDPKLKGNWTLKIGRGDHGDILTVPVSDRGIEIQQISQVNYEMPHGIARNLGVVGAVVSSSLATAFVLTRKRR